MLTATRIRAADGQVLGQTVQRVAGGGEVAVLELVGSVASGLFPHREEDAAVTGQTATGHKLVWVRGVGLSGVAVAGVLALLALAVATVPAGITLVDVAKGGRPMDHAIKQQTALMSDAAWGMMLGLGLLALVAALTSGAVLAASVVL